MVFVMFLALVGCDKFGGDVSLVKGGALELDKSTTIGQALDGNKFFKSKTWSAVKDEQGRRIVRFTGEFIRNTPDDHKSANMVLDFLINADNTYQYAGYRFNYVTNGESQNAGMWSTVDAIRLIYANQSNLCDVYENFVKVTTRSSADREAEKQTEEDKIRSLAGHINN